MGVYPTLYRLPTDYSTAIGRLVSRFAVLESALRKLIYALLETGPKFGRVAVKSPRIQDSFTMIEDLMALKSFTTTLDIKLMKQECIKFERFRDQVAHGVWVKHPQSDVPVLQITRGSYSEKPGGRSIKARIHPQAMKITLENFKDYTRGVDFALNAVKQLANELAAQHDALHKKSLEQLKQHL